MPGCADLTCSTPEQLSRNVLGGMHQPYSALRPPLKQCASASEPMCVLHSTLTVPCTTLSWHPVLAFTALPDRSTPLHTCVTAIDASCTLLAKY